MIKKAIILLLFVIVAVILCIALFAASFNLQTPITVRGTSKESLLVDGLVQNTLNLTLDELKAMPKTSVNAVLYCVDSPGTPIAQGNWTGVKLSFILGLAKVYSGAIKIAFFAADGYTTDLTITTGMRQDIIIAYELNSVSLTEKMRLVVPGMWGYKWISVLNHIELVNFDFKGTWESGGYLDEANI